MHFKINSTFLTCGNTAAIFEKKPVHSNRVLFYCIRCFKEQVMDDIVHCQCHRAPTVPLMPNAVPPAVPQWPRAQPQCAQRRSNVFALRVQRQRWHEESLQVPAKK